MQVGLVSSELCLVSGSADALTARPFVSAGTTAAPTTTIGRATSAACAIAATSAGLAGGPGSALPKWLPCDRRQPSPDVLERLAEKSVRTPRALRCEIYEVRHSRQVIDVACRRCVSAEPKGNPGIMVVRRIWVFDYYRAAHEHYRSG